MSELMETNVHKIQKRFKLPRLTAEKIAEAKA